MDLTQLTGPEAVRETAYLVDNSAYLRARKPVVAQRLGPLLGRGLLHTCQPIELEAGRGFGSKEFERSLELRRQSLIQVVLPDDVWERAAAIQAVLASESSHSAPSVVDLLIAACADRHGLTVLHYDADFDAITAATGIPSEWVAARGMADVPDQGGSD